MRKKSVAVAYLMWFLGLFGTLGFQRFYLNKPVTGILWVFTSGLFWFGAIYDFFSIPAQVRSANMTQELAAINEKLFYLCKRQSISYAEGQ